MNKKTRFAQSIAHATRTRRALLGMTVAQLSEKTGLSKRHIAQLEDGSANPNIRSLEMLADALGVTVIDILSAAPTNLCPPIARRAYSTCVYIVKSGDTYKIGYTSNLKNRLSAIATGCPEPVEVRDVIHGAGLKEERALHRKFEAKRVSGEWFALDEEDLAFIKRFGDDLASLFS